MLNETRVALRGNVATEPVLKLTLQGTAVCSFRLAVTARRYSSSDSKVVDAETSWYTVTCWRSLAENAASSLAKGQGVVVHGRLRVRDFVHEGQPRTSADLTAEALGHDLTWGTSSFTPARRPRAEETRDDSDRSEADALASAVSVGDLRDLREVQVHGLDGLDGPGGFDRFGGVQDVEGVDVADPGSDGAGGLDPARPLVDVGPEPF